LLVGLLRHLSCEVLSRYAHRRVPVTPRCNSFGVCPLTIELPANSHRRRSRRARRPGR
jgi:hypothetical protein